MKKSLLFYLRVHLGRLLDALFPHSRAKTRARFVVRMRVLGVPAELANRWFDYLDRRVPAPRGDRVAALWLVTGIYARGAVCFSDLVTLSMYLGDAVGIDQWSSHVDYLPASYLVHFMRDFPLERADHA